MFRPRNDGCRAREEPQRPPGDSDRDTARRIHNGLVDGRPALIAQCLGAADVAIKTKYDPHNAFHLNVNIPPKAQRGRNSDDSPVVGARDVS